MIWVKLNIKQFKMRSEDRKLTPRDISRKSKKLEKTLRQLEGLNKGTRKYHRKMFKAEKTLDQLQTGKSGIRPNKPAFNMSGYKLPHMAPLNNNHTGGWNSQADKKVMQALTQKQKDSLHEQARKFGKSYFSPKFGVNVDTEDGVLESRPTFKPDLDDFSKLPENQRGGYTVEELESLYPLSEGRRLTYDIEDKPIEDLVKQAYSERRDAYMSNVGKKKHKMLPPQTEEQAAKEFLNESYSTRFNPKTRQIEDLVSSSGDGAISEEELAKVPSYLRNPFQQ